jgi:DNA modification methylase
MIYVQDSDFTLYHGDCLDVLRELPAEFVHCCVTSPPYWGLRDYGHDGQIGLEQTPDEYVARMVAVFREVRRVLRDDGTLWLNLGDSYAANRTYQVPQTRNANHDYGDSNATVVPDGLKPKDLVGIPWRVAFALQADGWWLRSDIIWSKPNPMPESVTDRPTKSHEYVFLLTKSARYFFDAAAIREPATFYGPNGANGSRPESPHSGQMLARSGNKNRKPNPAAVLGNGDTSHGIPWEGFDRNARSVWEIATQPYAEAHFATFPQELPRRCIAAGSPAGGTVLDPFMGSGTTALVARNLGRNSIGIELNSDYCALAARRLGQQSLLTADYDY